MEGVAAAAVVGTLEAMAAGVAAVACEAAVDLTVDALGDLMAVVPEVSMVAAPVASMAAAELMGE